MAVAFSTDGSSVIERKIATLYDTSNTALFNDKYELSYCKKWIKRKEFKRVALQFPDKLLTDASGVVKWLENSLNDVQFYILADTSYGSCCVDEVAAEHYKADCIIHFGHACLSPTRRLPVLYVFALGTIDALDCFTKLKQVLSEDTMIVVLYDTSYYYSAMDLFKALKREFKTSILSDLNVSDNGEIPITCQCDDQCDDQCECSNIKKPSTDKSNGFQCGSRTFIPVTESDVLENYTMIYVGSEGPTLTNLMMNWNKCTFYSYNPLTKNCRKETLNVNKALMKRYYMVEKIKDAKIIGILVGTLGVANYIQAIQQLKELLKKVGKKYYTFLVGKLNVAKLANFMEIDIYVFVSCAENSLVDSSEFYRPVVTPFEVELACNPDREWTGEYVTDFQEILPGGQSYVSIPEGKIQETMDISLVTGAVRNLGVQENEENIISKEIIQRDDNLKVALSGANTAGDFLAGRHWQGLEPQLGKTPVSKAVEGRRGIAIGYEEEPSLPQS